jgi:hypothetical protein
VGLNCPVFGDWRQSPPTCLLPVEPNRASAQNGIMYLSKGVGSCRSTMVSACRWMIFQAPCSKRKSIVARRSCCCGSVCPAYRTLARSIATVYANLPHTSLTRYSKVDLGAARAERAHREQVALADLRNACLSQAAEHP